jgi:Na+/H+ antiporter NhaD/arsenite permease-like protein
LNRYKLPVFLVCFLLLLALPAALVAAEEAEHELGRELPVWSVLPFVGMLLSIAIFPLLRPHWWEKHLLQVAIFWSAVFLIPFAFGFGPAEAVYELLEIVLLDYLPFIVLLWGLFAVAGGIALRGSLAGSPRVNLVLLLIGTLLASWVGTTGASMLLIRPVIRANKWRRKKTHIIVFFIFLVSNIGGSLTPLGDPPLFLGFLRGVPFLWTMKLLPLLVLNAVILLAALFIMDTVLYKKELAEGRRPDAGEKEPLSVKGLHNLIFLALIIFAVILSGTVPSLPFFADQVTGEAHGLPIYAGIVLPFSSILQMLLIIIAGCLSVVTTNKAYRELNHFTWGPIKEVASLFIGIFITMIPALAILNARGGELGLVQPWQFFWATGALSSFLDNAPTYLVFLTTAGSLGAAEGLSTAVGVVGEQILLAISAGAVFMGANTYIGNAPNFMVRSIAEENEIKMPSFFGYMGWSLCCLIPLFIIDTFVFFLR